MAEDQSVFGRKQIYYDQSGGEALICSDSEEEIAELKEEKHKFSEAEDQMLRMVFHELGVTEEVLTILGQNIKATSSEFQSEKQLYSYGLEENGKPCSNECYLQTRGGVEDASESTDAISGEPFPDNIGISEKRLCDRIANVFSETVVISKSGVGALNIDRPILPIASEENLGKRKVFKDRNMTLGSSTVRSDNFQDSASKMQKKVSGLDLDYMETEGQPTYTGPFDDKKQKIKHVLNETVGSANKSYTVPVTFACDEENSNIGGDEANNTIHAHLIKHSFDSVRQRSERAPEGFEWKSIEKDLYLKGVEIFGKNRVGFFTKRHIEAGEELFYDYRYCPEQAPVWAGEAWEFQER